MNISQLAKDIYLKFSTYEGSKHIASEFAILKLLELVKIFKVQSVFEIGLGIGTLPSAIFELTKGEVIYTGTEPNDFCKESLSNNIPKIYYQKITVLDDVPQKMKKNQKYDLIIVDGVFTTIEKIFQILPKRPIIAVEGDRKDQVDILKTYFPKSINVHCVSAENNDPNGVFDSSTWQGGVKVFFLKPSFKQYIYYIKNKFKSRSNYQKRRKYKAKYA